MHAQVEFIVSRKRKLPQPGSGGMEPPMAAARQQPPPPAARYYSKLTRRPSTPVRTPCMYVYIWMEGSVPLFVSLAP